MPGNEPLRGPKLLHCTPSKTHVRWGIRVRMTINASVFLFPPAPLTPPSPAPPSSFTSTSIASFSPSPSHSCTTYPFTNLILCLPCPLPPLPHLFLLPSPFSPSYILAHACLPNASFTGCFTCPAFKVSKSPEAADFWAPKVFGFRYLSPDETQDLFPSFRFGWTFTTGILEGEVWKVRTKVEDESF